MKESKPSQNPQSQFIPNYRFYNTADPLDAALQIQPLGLEEEQAKAAEVKQSLVDISPDSIKFNQTIGKGAFGVVYRGEYKGNLVAIKEVAPHKAKGGLQNLSPLDVLQAFEWEVSRLSTLSHTNLVHFYGVCQNEEGNLCLVMEYCPNGTLQDRFKKARNEILGIPLLKPPRAMPSVVAAEKSPAQGSYDVVEESEENKGVNPSPYDVVEEPEAKKAADPSLYHVVEELEAKKAANSNSYDVVVEENDSNAPPKPTSQSSYDVVPDEDNPQIPKSLLNPLVKPNKPQLIAPALPLNEIWRIALEMAYGLAYLHQKGTLHRDLKSENVLLDKNDHVKLADLGVAQVDSLVSSQEAQVVAKGMKDFRYAAPEEFEKQSTTACDMYSYGLVLLEMLTGEPIPDFHISWREQRKPEKIPDYCPASLRRLIEQCWSLDPKDRPIATTVIRNLETIAPEYVKQPTRACLAQKTSEILGEQRTALADYIPSDIEILQPSPKEKRNEKNEGEKKDPNISIQTQLQQFIQSKAPVCVIVGAGGLGKSLASYVFADELLKHSDSKIPLPILIRPAMARWTHAELQEGIQKALIHYDLSQQAIEELKQTPVLFIVDGYDELSGENQDNLPKQLRLDAWPNAKLLSSVRPDAVPQDKHYEIFSHQNQLIEYKLKPFDQAKVKTYLERFLLPEEIASSQESITHAPKLQQALTNPSVLSIFLKTWDSQKKNNLAQLTQAKIYETAIQHWVTTQIHHLPLFVQQILSGTSPGAKEVNSEDLLKAAQLWLYQTAFAMATHRTLSLIPIANHSWNQLTPKINQYAQNVVEARDRQIAGMSKKEADLAQKRVLLNVERYQQFLQNKVQQFFALCPLQERNGQQQFIHKSLFEYIVAKGIVEALSVPASHLFKKEAPPIASSEKKEKTEEISHRHIFCQKEVTSQATYLITLGLNPSFILWDSGVLYFLQSVSQPQDLADWEAWIETSRENGDANLLAACAITALNGLNKILAYRDWAGIRIPDADLRGALLEHTDLTGANLQNVRLEAATLYNTKLQQALLTGVRFGQWPMLQFKDLVNCIAFHPNGTQLAIGLSKTHQILLQNIESKYIVTSLNGHTDIVSSVSFSPNGMLLASGSYDKTVRLWSVDTGTTRTILKGHTSAITSVVFWLEGMLLASGSADTIIHLWAVDTGTIRLTLKGHSSIVSSIAFSPDGMLLASGSYDQTVRLWPLCTNTRGTILKGHTFLISSVAFSPDGKSLASGSGDATVRLWSVDTGTTRAILKRDEQSASLITSIAFSPNGKYLASGRGGAVDIWSVDTGIIRATLEGHIKEINTIAFSPDGNCIASGGGDIVRLWLFDMNTAPATLQKQIVYSAAFSPNGKSLASGNYWDGTVCVWSVDTGTAYVTLNGHTDSVNSVAFSPNGTLLASGSVDTTVRLWSLSTSTAYATLNGHTDSVTSVTFSPDGKSLASGSADGTVRLWSLGTSTAYATLNEHMAGVTSVTFSPDGKSLASGSLDYTVRLWAVDTGTTYAILIGHISSVTSVAFSPDGKSLASGSVDGTVRLWSMDTGTTYATLMGHINNVTSVAFSPDGKSLASASLDHTVRLWDLRMNISFNTLNFLRPVISVIYATSKQLGILVGDGIQYWTQSESQALSSSEQPGFHLVWRTDVSTKLCATGCSIEKAIGLNQKDIDLLEQLGAKNKLASERTPPPQAFSAILSAREFAEITDIITRILKLLFNMPQIASLATSTTTSASASESISTLQSLNSTSSAKTDIAHLLLIQLALIETLQDMPQIASLATSTTTSDSIPTLQSLNSILSAREIDIAHRFLKLSLTKTSQNMPHIIASLAEPTEFAELTGIHKCLAFEVKYGSSPASQKSPIASQEKGFFTKNADSLSTPVSRTTQTTTTTTETMMTATSTSSSTISSSASGSNQKRNVENLVAKFNTMSKKSSVSALPKGKSSQSFFSLPTTISATLTTTSVSVLKSTHTLQSPSGISETKLVHTNTKLNKLPTQDSSPASQKSPIAPQKFFTHPPSNNADSVPTTVPTTTQTTTTSTSSSTSSSSVPVPVSNQKGRVAGLIAKFEEPPASASSQNKRV